MRVARESWTSTANDRNAFRIVAVVAGVGLGVMLLTPARAQSMPDTENGRYTLSPVPNGVLRLDTRNGTMSTCNNNGNGWACYAMPDERAALDAEIGRLQGDNEKLKTQLAQRDSSTGKIDEAYPKSDSLKKDGTKSVESQRKLELTLPSDQDIDRAMGFLERAWRRLVDMANRIQRNASGKI